MTNSPGSGWIEPVSETNTDDLLKRSLQTLNTDLKEPFMHLEFQVKIIILITMFSNLINNNIF